MLERFWVLCVWAYGVMKAVREEKYGSIKSVCFAQCFIMVEEKS